MIICSICWQSSCSGQWTLDRFPRSQFERRIYQLQLPGAKLSSRSMPTCTIPLPHTVLCTRPNIQVFTPPLRYEHSQHARPTSHLSVFLIMFSCCSCLKKQFQTPLFLIHKPSFISCKDLADGSIEDSIWCSKLYRGFPFSIPGELYGTIYMDENLTQSPLII